MMLKGKQGSAMGNELGIPITVRLPNGTSLPVTLHPFDRISKIYKLIAQETGAAETLIRIKYTGKVLRQTQTVESLGIIAEMILKAEVVTSRMIELNITSPSGETRSVNAQNVDSVSRVCQKAVSEFSLTEVNYQLQVGDRILPVNESLYDLKISNGSSLKLIKKDTPVRKAATNDVPEAARDEPLPDLGMFDANGKSVEVVFSFDTTGSMYSVLERVRQELRDIVDRLLRDVPMIRVGLIAHGDYCDHRNYVVRSHDLSADADSLKEFACNVPSTGGGDAPEAYEWVLHKAQQLDWSEDSAKALVVIGDCCPHPPSMTDQNCYWHTELDLLRGMGVKIYGVQAYSNVGAAPFYKELADRTNGGYLKFDNFSLIKDMFLAVCYNEAGEEQLDNYVEELQAAGELTQQKEEIITQLKTQQANLTSDKAAEMDNKQISFNAKQSHNYIAQAWFDKDLDKGQQPQYFYDTVTDRWSGVDPRAESRPSAASEDALMYTTTLKTPTKKRPSLLCCFRRS